MHLFPKLKKPDGVFLTIRYFTWYVSHNALHPEGSSTVKAWGEKTCTVLMTALIIGKGIYMYRFSELF